MSETPTYALQRFVRTSHGVFGYLHMPRVLLMTVEEEWQDNQPRISCIPAGRYLCKRRRYHKGGYDTWEITDVPGRDAILFHKGNTEEDLQGCVALGMNLGVLNVTDEDTGFAVPKLAVTNSKGAFTIFMVHTSKLDAFYVEITDPKA